MLIIVFIVITNLMISINDAAQTQVAAWLWSVQEIPSLAERAEFRELLGMPPLDEQAVQTLDAAVTAAAAASSLSSSGSAAVVPSISSSSSTSASSRTWTGSCLDDFKFLDVNSQYKYMYHSCRETHGLTARGRTYLTDNKKVLHAHASDISLSLSLVHHERRCHTCHRSRRDHPYANCCLWSCMRWSQTAENLIAMITSHHEDASSDDLRFYRGMLTSMSCHVMSFHRVLLTINLTASDCRTSHSSLCSISKSPATLL